MSNFTNWHEDFPDRCLRLIGQFEKNIQNRLSTFSLMVAPSLLIAPYERLQTFPGKRINPQRDFDRFKKAKEEFDKLMEGKFEDAPFMADAQDGSWKYGKIATNIGQPDLWADEKGHSCPDESFWKGMSTLQVNFVWECLRDSLAHWNIATTDSLFQQKDRIQYLLFYRSKNNRYPWDAIKTTEKEFFRFIKAWATFLTESPAREALEGFEAA
ncbi:MAG: hypothetical protein HYZ11_08885 [Candidatus Tectomicrobia bacterium]|uniref:Uncharacterized protein n=1 Tax=Tectimicrobiota bacterium TaxID=2528274 RepID=A0A932HZ33_UNCTE|nr:hypothetical protein [Candidatus Tectomicrobia bacterium]